MAVAAEHPLAQRAAVQNADVAAFVAECQRGGVSALALETQEKKGVATRLYALHPISGERFPVWVANFVLMGYIGRASCRERVCQIMYISVDAVSLKKKKI